MTEVKCVICGRMYEEEESKKDTYPKKCDFTDCCEEDTISKAQPVKINEFDMKFGSMILFMIKWVIASIPAMIILGILWFIFMSLFLGGLASF